MPLVPGLLLAPLPSTTRGQPLRISGDEKGTSIVYCNGRSVVVRDLAVAARFAPSGAYIASGDAAGNVKVWDTLGTDRVIKLDQRVLSSRVNDIAWDFESKRIIVGGDGKEKFGSALLFDTGSSVGEISGHSKAINACALRPMRPFRAVTASDDMTVNLHNGVPFKFARSIKDHTRFVYDVRYSPDGQVFASTGADGKIFLYNGDNGDRLSELSASADSHAGSIFSLCWSSDSRHLLSSSADCTAKLWDVTAGTVVQTWKLGSEVGDQQVGNWWRGDYMISVSLKGDINYLTRDSPTPSRVVMGHQRPITALAASSSNTFVTGSSDGRVLQWSAANGTPTAVEGPGHSNQVTGIACSAPNIGIATSTGMDDTARFISLAKHSYGPNTISLDGVPRGIGTVGDLTAIVLANKVATVMQQTQKSIVDLTFSATCVAVRPDASEVAIGGEDNRVHIFRVGSDGKLEGTSKTLDGNRGAISTLVYSPDGSLLLAGDSQRKIVVYDAGSGAVKIDQWVFHNSRVNSAAFSPNGKYAVTGSLDTNLILWTVDDPFAKAQLKNAHLEAVNCVAFLDDETVVSGGQDAALQIYKRT